MTVQHISEVLKEFYEDRAREDLASIAYNGLDDVLDSGGEDEIIALMQLGFMDQYDISRVQHRFLTYNLWNN